MNKSRGVGREVDQVLRIRAQPSPKSLNCRIYGSNGAAGLAAMTPQKRRSFCPRLIQDLTVLIGD